MTSSRSADTHAGPTPLTLARSGPLCRMLSDDLDRSKQLCREVYPLALGGTRWNGYNSAPASPKRRCRDRQAHQLPFVFTAPNKFTVQGAHDALVQLSGTPARSRSRCTRSHMTFA